MSQNKNRINRRKINKRKRNYSMNVNESVFIKCSVGGAVHIKTGERNGLHVFDSIGFMAKDASNNISEIEGLFFDQKKGWYEKGAVLPKYYGKDVYDACINYAVDRAIKDNLCLGVAIFGKERPARSAMVLNRDEIVSRFYDGSFIVS